MSSAAIQSTTGLPPSNRHYTPTHSSPTREEYHANQQQQQIPSVSSSSSSRPSRKSNATGQGGGTTNSNLMNDSNSSGAFHIGASPAHMSQTNSPMSSRAALSSPVAVPSAAVNAAAAAISDYPQPSPVSSERRRRHNNPPVAPPRTSSQQQQQHQSMSGAPSSSSSSRRAAAAAATGSDSPRARTRDTRGDDSARRRQQQEQEYAQRVAASGGARSAAATALPIRNHGSQPSSHGPSRETSEILNSVTVSRDEVDVEREKARLAMAQQDDYYDDAAPPPIVPTSNAPEQQADESRRGGRSRHDHSRREKQIKFGEYILGNTIGEGEFGKVKLGWKQEGGVQVAIKLIKKDILGSNPTRMAKIMREVNILRQLNHPNIVQLHKMEESEHHYGIVLEYASGGELFDYILNHRYLKDHAARRLFAQLISGVGYLHKKGIVHRDLKLENLLLDRNRNIIITDFGFANTFDPTEELTEDEEINLVDREYIKRMGFDIVKPNGMRKADLMQTSCGSPCYAAPELVVSDSLYTGRKVDVWSCGVILYAMLAGYLPFDDDPKNPEGDNINLLYKYIVNTPLTFPEYVTPHARDLLRRILVPNPRQRADLFEVARHSWLSEYANVVEFITSSTTSSADIQNIPISADDIEDGRMLGRSSSVREASKKAVVSPTIGGLISKAGNVDPESEAALLKQQKDNKRRTVQVEYVAPTTQTQRGGEATSGGGKTRARSGSQGPIAVNPNAGLTSPNEKPLPRDPPTGKSSRDPRRPPSAHRTTGTAAAVAAAGTGAGTTRANRDGSRAVSEAAYMVQGSGGRPVTGGSVGPANPRTTPNRASFGQPVPPTVAGTNAQGRIQQPKSNSGRNYVISNPIPQDSSTFGRPSISVPPKFAQVSGFAEGEGENASTGKPSTPEVKGHRRSNTIGDITDKLLGRSGSIFGGKNRKKPDDRQSVGMEKASRKYPPVSMANNTAIQSGVVPSDEPRASMDSTARQSRRSFSLGLGKKRSGSIEGSQTSHEKQHTRRFSLLPGSFSLKSIGINKDYDTGPESQTDLPIQEPPQGARLGSPTDSLEPAFDGMYTHLSESQQAAAESGRLQQQQRQEQRLQQSPAMQQGRPSLHYQQPPQQPQHQRHVSASQFERQRPSALQEVTDNVQRNPPRSAPYQGDIEAFDPRRANPNVTNARGGRVVLQKNKRMADAYDTDEFAKHHDRSGSSGAARRVMDFFRRRAKARGGDE